MKEQKKESVISLVTREEEKQQPNLLKVIDLRRFSSIEKVRRVTGYMLRFVSNCRSKNRDERITDRRLSVQELKYAEKLLVKEAQKSIPRDRKFKQLENTLGLETNDEGILRCAAREE